MANTELLTAISNELAKGLPAEEIIQLLTKRGWSEQDIRGALAIQELHALGDATGNQRLIRELDAVGTPSIRETPHQSPLLVLFAMFLIVAAGSFYFLNPEHLTGMLQRGTATLPVEVSSEEGHVYTHTYTFATTTESKPAKTTASASLPSPAETSTLPATPYTEITLPSTTVPQMTKPTVTIKVVSSVAAGASVTLAWSSKYATSCSSTGFDIGGAESGSVTIAPTTRTTYTLTCTGPGGSTTEKKTVSIDAIEAPPPEQIAQAPTPPPDPIPQEPPPVVPTPPTASEPTTPPQEVPTVDPAPPRYAVYPGCESPGTTFAREVYIDPQGGSDSGSGSRAAPYRSLTTALREKKIQPGDHVVLLAGDYGSIGLTKAVAPELASASAWTWFDFQSGARSDVLHIIGLSRTLVTGIELSGTKIKTAFVWADNNAHLVIADATVYTTSNTANWTVADWINTARIGMQSNNSTCVAFSNNSLKNVRGGFTVGKDGMTRSQNATKTLFQDNVIRNVSADGFVVNASDVIVKNNKLYDEYVGQEEGDGNHDDALQIFALNGRSFDNIRIEGNWIQETTNPNRPFISTLQGIALFDGLVTNLRVIDNVVLTSHWHGISLYGVQDSVIDHNTVANITNNGRATWISVPPAKGNAWQPTGTKVTNNIALSYVGGTGVVFENNQNLDNPITQFKKFDTATMDFDLRPKAGSLIDGTDTGAYPTKAVSAAAPASTVGSLLASAYEAVASLAKTVFKTFLTL